MLHKLLSVFFQKIIQRFPSEILRWIPSKFSNNTEHHKFKIHSEISLKFTSEILPGKTYETTSKIMSKIRLEIPHTKGFSWKTFH